MAQFTQADHMAKDEIAYLYVQAKLCGRADVVFWDGGIQSWQDWMEYLRVTSSWLVHVQDPGRDIGFFWLNGVMGHTAMMHFCNYATEFSQAVEFGRECLAYIWRKTALESVYSCTPKPYRHLLPFIKSVGFRVLGEIPGACYMKRRDKHLPGIVSVCARGAI